MKTISKVYQTEFGEGNGNCWSACIASMLKMKLEDVPNFCLNVNTWWKDTQEWMMNRGMFLIEMEINNDSLYVSDVPDGIHCIMSGKSPRGDFHHSVIGRHNKGTFYYKFDPHPDGTFLDGEVKYITFIGTLGE